MNVSRRVAGVVASLAAGTALTVTGSASAAVAPTVPSTITVHSSDYEVDSGEQFVLRGRMIARNRPVVDARVKVQAYRGAGWHDLTGAVVRTREDGRYRVRVILFAGGDRDLRVVGDPRGDRIRVARAYTVVRVLR